jgi:hypothetical protein
MGSNIWMALSQNAGQNRSTDNGLTFSSVTLPSFNIVGAAKNSTTLLIADTSGNFYSSTTGATGSYTTIGKALGNSWGLLQGVGGSLQSDGTNFYATILNTLSGSLVSGQVGVSADGSNWSIRTVINRSWADGSSSAAKNIIGVDTSQNFVMAPLVINTGAAYGNFGTTTGVGIPYSASSSNANTQMPTVTYVRLG